MPNQNPITSRSKSNSARAEQAVCVEVLEGRQLCSHYVNGSHTFVDHTFANANWMTTPFPLGEGGYTSAYQVLKGGHGGRYQLVTDTVYAGGVDSALYGFHGNLKAIYNPAKSGAIVSLNYGEDNRLVSGFGQGEGTAAALEQNGVVYFALGHTFITPQTKWKHVFSNKLTAADFSTLDGTAHPDFSQTAAPIEFGYARSNSPGGSAGYTIEAGMDNWSIKVKTRKLV